MVWLHRLKNTLECSFPSLIRQNLRYRIRCINAPVNVNHLGDVTAAFLLGTFATHPAASVFEVSAHVLGRKQPTFRCSRRQRTRASASTAASANAARGRIAFFSISELIQSANRSACKKTSVNKRRYAGISCEWLVARTNAKRNSERGTSQGFPAQSRTLEPASGAGLLRQGVPRLSTDLQSHSKPTAGSDCNAGVKTIVEVALRRARADVTGYRDDGK